MYHTHSKYISSFAEWKEQKEFLNFTEEDEDYLKKLHPYAMDYADECVY